MGLESFSFLALGGTLFGQIGQKQVGSLGRLSLRIVSELGLGVLGSAQAWIRGQGLPPDSASGSP